MTDADAAPTDDAPPPADQPAGAAKDKFREALERKQGRRHPHEAATSGDSKIHDSRGAAGGKRTFRRKSG